MAKFIRSIKLEVRNTLSGITFPAEFTQSEIKINRFLAGMEALIEAVERKQNGKN